MFGDVEAGVGTGKLVLLFEYPHVHFGFEELGVSGGVLSDDFRDGGAPGGGVSYALRRGEREDGSCGGGGGEDGC